MSKINIGIAYFIGFTLSNLQLLFFQYHTLKNLDISHRNRSYEGQSWFSFSALSKRISLQFKIGPHSIESNVSELKLIIRIIFPAAKKNHSPGSSPQNKVIPTKYVRTNLPANNYSMEQIFCGTDNNNDNNHIQHIYIALNHRCF